MVNLIIFLTLLVVGYFTGSHFEKKHFQSIIKREKGLINLPTITGQWKDKIPLNSDSTLVSGGTVVASDYFKNFVASLRQLFGGRITAYESLIDRGRREAILRMKEKAVSWGAEQIINVRIETSTINSGAGKKNGMPVIELFAYGTALRPKEEKATS